MKYAKKSPKCRGDLRSAHGYISHDAPKMKAARCGTRASLTHDACLCDPPVRKTRRFTAVVLCTAATALLLTGANYRTENFTVSAQSSVVAKAVGDAAERYRLSLAEEWLGEALPPWSQPCPIRVDEHVRLAPTGRTSFVFYDGRPEDWEMLLAGPFDVIVDCVLPHEVMHTVLATHFGRPLPRWAEEGTCTIVEHPAEVRRHEQHFTSLLRNNATLPLARLFALEHYPRDPIPFYLQSHSISAYLVAQKGRRQFIRFLDDGSRTGDWNQSLKSHYGLASLATLEQRWRASSNARSSEAVDSLATSSYR
jgi:hypothetical protein